MEMTCARLWYLIRSDYFRYHGTDGLPGLLRDLFLNRGFKITASYRVAHFFYCNRWNLALKLFNLYHFSLQSLYSCELPYETTIGPGFYFGHVFGTIINRRSVIGKNVNMSHAVTLGMISTGKRKGYPVIGDNVYIAPGSKVLGGIQLGKGTAVGANAVVLKDTPEDAVVVGNPGEVISLNGSGDYVIHTVETDTLPRIPTDISAEIPTEDSPSEGIAV